MRSAPTRVIRQYLQRYASAGAAELASQIHERYHSVLIVPAHREAPDFSSGYERALCNAGGRVLVIVVVNAAAPLAEAAWPEHALLLAALRAGKARRLAAAAPAWLARRDDWDVLSIDRAHPAHCFPAGEGVGLARRMGCDLALELYAAGRIELPWLCCTDADAELPASYFCAVERELPVEASGALYGFWHVPGDDATIDAGTAVYELGLRYYVAGLTYAGSPYAYHALGSAMAIHAGAYAAVRGFPRRLSGEDFYLLNKLAKVGYLWRADGQVIRLRSRASARTVHGTGVMAAKLAAQGAGDQAMFYHPEIFPAIAAWLEALECFAEARDMARARALVAASPHAGSLARALDGLGAWAALDDGARHARSHAVLRARLHEWFDAFRTLKLIHALRSSELPSLPFRDALAGAAFGAPGWSEAAVDDLRATLRDQERLRPAVLGVPALRAPLPGVVGVHARAKIL